MIHAPVIVQEILTFLVGATIIASTVWAGKGKDGKRPYFSLILGGFILISTVARLVLLALTHQL